MNLYCTTIAFWKELLQIGLPKSQSIESVTLRNLSFPLLCNFNEG